MKLDNKRMWADVLKRLEKECYTIIPRETKAKDVTPAQIKAILSGIIQRDAVVHANRVRSYLMAAFNYGLKADNDPMNTSVGITFGVEVNPVSAIPKQSSAEKVGDVWLTLEELRVVMAQFSQATNAGPLMQHLIHFCIYTGGQRPFEMIARQWSAIDWQQKTLLVIAGVSKNKREHLIPLTESALQELAAIKALTKESHSPYIFPLSTNGERPVRTDSLAPSIMYFRAFNPEFKVFTARDLRRTCKTLMGESGISKEIRDRIQNHALNDVSSKHYDRYDYLTEKRRALEIWEDRVNHCQQQPESNVVSLFGRRDKGLSKYALNSAEERYQPGSEEQVLANRLGIIDEQEMEALESGLLLMLYEQLFIENQPPAVLTFEDISTWHRQWLGNVYDWAGKLRNTNLTKDGFLFAAADRIPLLLDGFGKQFLSKSGELKMFSHPELVSYLAECHVEFILIHPFREGNGRLSRLLCDMLSVLAGKGLLDYSLWGEHKVFYFKAIPAGVSGNYSPMMQLMGDILPD